jgi:hypothetical protein
MEMAADHQGIIPPGEVSAPPLPSEMASCSIHRAPFRANPTLTKVIIQIPCYDEEHCLSYVLAALLMTMGLVGDLIAANHGHREDVDWKVKQVESGMRRGNT